VRLKLDIIVAGGTTNVVAAKEATSLIPIVFVAAWPRWLDQAAAGVISQGNRGPDMEN
jgi:hypothetical protein